jgi:hypothetical protein
MLKDAFSSSLTLRQDKLECLLEFFQANVMLAGKANSLLNVAPLCPILALLANIRLT